MTICLLNFSKEFVPMVEAGIKPHTIRAKRADGRDPLPGDTLHLYAGLRTKSARLLRREPCVYATEITIQQSAGNVHHILMGGMPLRQEQIEYLAVDDGFAGSAEFIRFFESAYGLPFTGILIGWTPTPTVTTRH